MPYRSLPSEHSLPLMNMILALVSLIAAVNVSIVIATVIVTMPAIVTTRQTMVALVHKHLQSPL